MAGVAGEEPGAARAEPPRHTDSPCPPRSLQHGWEVSGGRIAFHKRGDSADGGADGTAPPAVDLIGHCLNYAREIERIV